MHTVREVRAALREREAKWYFALTAKTDCEIHGNGLFTCDNPRVFYSSRAIASFRGKLLKLRDFAAPDRFISRIGVAILGEVGFVHLSFDQLEQDFRAHVPFKRKAMYYICLTTEPKNF